MTPLDHLRLALAELDDRPSVASRLPLAIRNLTELQGGYPSGHTSSAHIPNDDDPPPDVCRQAMAQVERLVHQIAVLSYGLAGEPLRPRFVDLPGTVRFYAARSTLAHWAIPLLEQDASAVTQEGATDCRAIRAHCTDLRALVARWAFEPQRGDPGKDNKAHHDEGCRDCATMKVWTPTFTAGLCDWCHSFHRRYRKAAPVGILRAHHDGRRITERDINRALGGAA